MLSALLFPSIRLISSALVPESKLRFQIHLGFLPFQDNYFPRVLSFKNQVNVDILILQNIQRYLFQFPHGFFPSHHDQMRLSIEFPQRDFVLECDLQEISWFDCQLLQSGFEHVYWVDWVPYSRLGDAKKIPGNISGSMNLFIYGTDDGFF